MAWTIPYDALDPNHWGVEAREARRLTRLYHKGHRQAWDGEKVLARLVEEHGPPSVPDEVREPLGRLFAIIMWGELAAWQISAHLAEAIESVPAKMAATSQAFDEARHSYVMHDYLEMLGALPERMPREAERVLEAVTNARDLAQMLLGMQLMVEPIALAIFHVVKALDVEPVLTALMPYYERDESRHVALGIQFLPALVGRLGPRGQLALWAFQWRVVTFEMLATGVMGRDIAALGGDPWMLVRAGKAKQLRAIQAMFERAPVPSTLPARLLERYSDVLTAFVMPGEASRAARLAHAWRLLREGLDVSTEEFLPEIPDEAVPLIGRNEPRQRT